MCRKRTSNRTVNKKVSRQYWFMQILVPGSTSRISVFWNPACLWNSSRRSRSESSRRRVILKRISTCGWKEEKKLQGSINPAVQSLPQSFCIHSSLWQWAVFSLWTTVGTRYWTMVGLLGVFASHGNMKTLNSFWHSLLIYIFQLTAFLSHTHAMTVKSHSNCISIILCSPLHLTLAPLYDSPHKSVNMSPPLSYRLIVTSLVQIVESDSQKTNPDSCCPLVFRK